MRTIHEQKLFEFAISLPADVLADAAVDQARTGRLSEAAAQDVSDQFAHAASVARERRFTATAKFTEEAYAA